MFNQKLSLEAIQVMKNISSIKNEICLFVYHFLQKQYEEYEGKFSVQIIDIKEKLNILITYHTYNFSNVEPKKKLFPFQFSTIEIKGHVCEKFYNELQFLPEIVITIKM